MSRTEPTPRASHRFENHTGEVKLMVAAGTLPELFMEAARGLAGLMLEDTSLAPDAEAESSVVQASDRELLLAAWINELIHLSETRRKVYTDIRIDSLSDRELRATLRGVPVEALRTAVKAATLHRLRIEERGGGFAAGIVLDV